MRAAGPTDGNRKHHPKAAPLETATRPLAVRVFSQPQKMVFDCVYGRPEKGDGCRQPAQRDPATIAVWATARHYITPIRRRYVSIRMQAHGTQAALSAVRYPPRRRDGQKSR